MLCVKCNDSLSPTECGYNLLFHVSFGFYFKVKLQYLDVMNNVRYFLEPNIRKSKYCDFWL